MDGDRDAQSGPGGEPEAPMFAWDEESHPVEASWAYQNEFVPAMFRPSAEVVLGQAPPGRGARVLDAGCGTGALALVAVELVGGDGSVAGLDVNPAQLEVARQLPEADAVEWREGNVTALPYADGAFDVVYSQHVLQFVPDRGAALREFRRVAAGGRVAVAVWGPVERNPVFAALAGALDAQGDDENAAIVRSPRVFADPSPLALLCEEAGLQDLELTTHDVPVRLASARRMIDELQPPLPDDASEEERERREAALAEAEARVAPLGGPDGLVFDDQLHLVVGRAG